MKIYFIFLLFTLGVVGGSADADAGKAAIFSGNFVKTLKSELNLFDAVYIREGSIDPTVVATNAPGGSLYMNTSGNLYIKQDSGTSTNWLHVAAGPGGGTVTNVSVVTNHGFSGTVSTSTTTPAITLGTTVTGIEYGDGTQMRAASALDFPTLNQDTTGVSSNVTGVVAIPHGGSGQTTQQAAINALTGTPVAGDYLRSDGTNAAWAALSASDITGVVPILHGGSGQTTQQAAINALTGSQTAGFYLRSDGTNSTLSALVATELTGIVPILNGGTGQSTQQAAIDALTGGQLAGDYLRSDGTHATLSALAASDLSGTVSIAHGGTSAVTQQAAINSLTGSQTAGNYLRSDGTNSSLSPLSADDVTGTLPITHGGTGATSNPAALHNLLGISNGGDSYGGDIKIGTNDNFGVSIQTNGVPQLNIDNVGGFFIHGVGGSFLAPPSNFGLLYNDPGLNVNVLANLVQSNLMTTVDTTHGKNTSVFYDDINLNSHTISGGITNGLFVSQVSGGGILADLTGVKGDVNSVTVANLTHAAGGSFSVNNDSGGAGNINEAVGVLSIVSADGSSVIPLAEGLRIGGVTAQNDVASTAEGIEVTLVAAVGTVNSAANGINIDSVQASGGSTTNVAVGLHIANSITSGGTGAATFAIRSDSVAPSLFAGDLTAPNLIGSTTVNTPSLVLNGTAISNVPSHYLQFSSGTLSGITANQIVALGKVVRAETVENVTATTVSFTCVANPILTLLDCGLAPTDCTTGTTTVGAVTLTAANTITTGSISNPPLAPGHYWAWEITSGTCTSLSVFGSAEAIMQ